MDAFVCDPHALFWHLMQSEELGRAAKRVFERADRGEAQIVIPAIVWFERYHLNEKYRFELDIVSELRAARDSPGYLATPMDPAEIEEYVSMSTIPEIHDRMIVVVARRRGVPCLTRDSKITDRGLIQCIWDDVGEGSPVGSARRPAQ